MHDTRTVVVVAGGDPILEDVIGDLPEGAFVVAADSGLDHALAIGLEVDLIIGDLDSVAASSLAASRGIPIEQYPAHKDHTDLELALDAAVRLAADRVIVIGGYGGRVDHFLANTAAIASPQLSTCEVEWLCGSSHIFVVRHSTQLHGTKGDIVSLIPVGGPVLGVKTSGLQWDLDDETLDPYSARGVSNAFTRPFAHVEIQQGTLLAILN